MDALFTVVLSLLGVVFFVVLCVLAFIFPSPFQFYLAKRIRNIKTGKPLSNNNYKFPLGDLTATLKNYEEGEGWRLKFLPEGACGWWALNFYDVQITNAEWLKQLLSYPETKFDRSFESFQIIRGLFGTSLLAANGDNWNRLHKILYKAFVPSNLEYFMPVFVRQTRKLAETLEATAATGSTTDMLNAFNVLTLDVIVETGFGEFVSEDDKKAISDSFRFVMSATQNPLHDIPVLRDLPLPANLRVRRAFKTLHQTADKIVAARRKEHESGSLSNSHEGKYMVDLLLDAKERDEELSDLELRDNIIMLMVAGSETTGTTLTWLLWHILDNPDIYEKVMREVDSLDISWDNFNVGNMNESMPYTTMVIQETLRFSSPVSGIPERILKEPMIIGDLDLPKGARVGAAKYVMHRNPEYWPNPNKFDPERFRSGEGGESASTATSTAAASAAESGEPTPATATSATSPSFFSSSSSATASKRASVSAAPKYYYLPFGAGRRTCMGKVFAMNEMRVVISLLLKYYNFKYDTSAGPVEKLWKVPTVVPRHGLPMFVTRR